MKSSRSQSPYMQSAGWNPYPQTADSRRASMRSHISHPSPTSESAELEEGEREKNRCPFPDCGRIFKDLKAHMLTHQTERPEKCPIPTCEYHRKGFSRKYDKNRHTLTHYKGTMICDFCPGSGSSSEKCFNRADVFKRHLTIVHGVEQNPPNSRKRTSRGSSSTVAGSGSGVNGRCSICARTYPTAQDFYEHLEECVLNQVQNIDPSEAINEKLLTSVADDQEVKNTLGRHNLPEDADLGGTTATVEEEEEDEEDEEEVSDDAEGEATGQHGATSGPGRPGDPD